MKMQSQSSLRQLKLEVDRRVALALVPVLLDKMIRFHARKYFTTCMCDYCLEKRKATIRVAKLPRYLRDDYKVEFSEKLKQLLIK